MTIHRISHRKIIILLLTLYISASNRVVAEDHSLFSFFHRDSKPHGRFSHLSSWTDPIFRRNKQISQPKRWQSLGLFNAFKGNKKEEEKEKKNPFLIHSSDQRQISKKVHQVQSNILQSFHDIKHGLEESFDTTVRPWTMERKLHRPNSQFSWTTSLVFANVILYGLQMFYPSITRLGTKRSDLILRGQELHRLFTPVFLHGNIPHLLMNTYSLQNIGPEVERLFGPGRFVATYLVAGVTGNLLSAINTPNPSLGASGAIFGLLGAYYTFLNRNGQLFGRNASMQMDNVGRTLFMNIIFGLASPGIDNWGHIGGALGGAMMAYYVGPKLFIARLPNGTRMIVDKPTFRLPRVIESIPEQIGKQVSRIKRRMQVDSELSLHRSKSRYWKDQQDWRRRRPIKPLFKD